MVGMREVGNERKGCPEGGDERERKAEKVARKQERKGKNRGRKQKK